MKNKLETNLMRILFVAIFALLFFGSNTIRFKCDENVGPCYPYSGKPDGHALVSNSNPLISPLTLLAGPILSPSSDFKVSMEAMEKIRIFDTTPANGGPLLTAYFLIKLLTLINIALWILLIRWFIRKSRYPVFDLVAVFIIGTIFVLSTNYLFFHSSLSNSMNIFSYMRYLQD